MLTETITLPEAAFSLCLKGRLNGVEAQLTVRGMTYDEFARNVTAVRGLLDPATAGQPAAGEVPTLTPQPVLEGWCSIHGVQMKLQSNDRGSWYSHKLPDGWCRGKEKKSA